MNTKKTGKKARKTLDYERPQLAQQLRSQYMDCQKALRHEIQYIEGVKTRMNKALKAYDDIAVKAAPDRVMRDLSAATGMVDEMLKEAGQLRSCADDLYGLAVRMGDTAQHFEKRLHTEKLSRIGTVIRGGRED